MTADQWATIKHFKPEEFVAPDKMSYVLLQRLDKLRDILGEPIHIGSNYREGDPLAHGDGDAVDIPCDSSFRLKLVPAAAAAGFTRIGAETRHTHLDVSKRLPDNVMWVDVSR